MQVIESRVEAAGSGHIRVITTIDITEHSEPEAGEMGAGPTGDAIPDRIVLALIANHGASMSLAEIQRAVGGNPATVNRQAWTLAHDAPDLQHRLVGWVVNIERGRYALSAGALRRLEAQGISTTGPSER